MAIESLYLKCDHCGQVTVWHRNAPNHVAYGVGAFLLLCLAVASALMAAPSISRGPSATASDLILPALAALSTIAFVAVLVQWLVFARSMRGYFCSTCGTAY